MSLNVTLVIISNQEPPDVDSFADATGSDTSLSAMDVYHTAFCLLSWRHEIKDRMPDTVIDTGSNDQNSEFRRLY